MIAFLYLDGIEKMFRFIDKLSFIGYGTRPNFHTFAFFLRDIIDKFIGMVYDEEKNDGSCQKQQPFPMCLMKIVTHYDKKKTLYNEKSGALLYKKTEPRSSVTFLFGCHKQFIDDLFDSDALGFRLVVFYDTMTKYVVSHCFDIFDIGRELAVQDSVCSRTDDEEL